MADSTIPAAIDALVVMFTVALPGAQVFDSDVTEDIDAEYVAVAIPDANDPSESPAVTFQQDWASLGAGRKSEDYDIRCELSSWAGDDTLSYRRTRAFQMLAALQVALRADPGLLNGGAVSPISGSGHATITAGTLITGDTTKGPTATLNFDVTVRDVRI